MEKRTKKVARRVGTGKVKKVEDKSESSEEILVPKRKGLTVKKAEIDDGVEKVEEVKKVEADHPGDEPRMENFRFNNQKCLLTYKGWLDKAEYKKWLNGKKKDGIKFVEIAHETGDQHHNYKHSHVLIDFGKAHQTRSVRWFDYEGVHPHISLVKSMQHWDNSLNYLAKEDKECASLATSTNNLVNGVFSCNNEEEAVRKYVKSPGDYIGVREMYRDHRMRKLNEAGMVVIEPDKMFAWQKAFVRVTNQSNSDRAINWVYDKNGKGGKTVWGQHLVDNFDGDWAVISSIGRESDFCQNVKNVVESGWKKVGLILDLPRNYEDKEQLYTCLENIVNGRITCTKYQGGNVNIGKPHIWVFSNFLPMIEKMSKDRWRIFEIGKHGKGCALLLYEGKKSRRVKIDGGIIPYSFIPMNDSASSSWSDYDVEL